MRKQGLILLLAFLACACSPKKGFGEYVQAVTVSSTENTLRFALDIDFRRSCDYSVQWWSDSRSDAMSSGVRHTQGGSESYIIKFLYPDTRYYAIIVVDGEESEVISFTSGSLPGDCPSFSVEHDDGSVSLEGYLMQWEASPSGYVTFCDYDGKVLWYEALGEEVRQAWYDPATQTIAAFTGFKEPDNDDFYRLGKHTVLLNLDGDVLMRWTTGPGNLEYPHHEIKLLEDGSLLCVNNVVKNFDIAGVETPVYGDGFTIITRDRVKLKEWDCFEGLGDINQEYLHAALRPNDLVHANSVAIDSNGDYYMTFNAISELWKIDGQSGEVLWRLGVHGNVSLDGDFPTGGLHAATVLEPDRILCYSNGSDKGYSSVVLFDVDSEAKTASYELNIPLPSEYSSRDRSNAAMISEDCIMASSTLSKKVVFMHRDGHIFHVLSRDGISYRAYWFENIPL